MKKIITTSGTEFAQNGKDLALIETTDRAGKPTMISSSDLKAGFENAENGVASTVDSNIIPANIKKDISILGVTGTNQSGPSLHKWDGTGKYTRIYLQKDYTENRITEDMILKLNYIKSTYEEDIPQTAFIKYNNTVILKAGMYYDSDKFYFTITTPGYTYRAGITQNDIIVQEINIIESSEGYEYGGGSDLMYRIPIRSFYREDGFEFIPDDTASEIAWVSDVEDFILNYIYVDEADRIEEPVS